MMTVAASRLSELVLRWDESRRQGRNLRAEELCHDCPELLEDLCRRLDALEALDSVLETGTEATTFPPPCLRGVEGDPGKGEIAGYEIVGELGSGGMGVVYRAFDQRRGAVVALKTVQRADSATLLRFKREFRALADVAHLNLVNLYELVSDGRDWFFTMELVNGVDFLTYVRTPYDEDRTGIPEDRGADAALSLPSTLQRSGYEQPSKGAAPHGGAPQFVDAADPPPPGLSSRQLGRLRSALRQLAEGVTALHDAGLLHRDLKPSNVLVTPQGRVVVLDFGLAAELGATGLHRSSGAHILGTIAYMAPEQAGGLPVSPASDWYSVGVMLYEALTGRLPFFGRPLEVLMDKQRLDPPAPREVVSDVPGDLDALCIELLRRAPESRPSGRELLLRLGQPMAEPERLPPDASASPPGVPFVGRQSYLATLGRAFESVRRGQTVVLLAHGRSGSGKTALIQRFLADLGRDEGTILLAGRCYEREAVPYKALDSLIDTLGRYLKHLPRTELAALLPRDIRPLVQVFPVLRYLTAVAASPRRAGDIPNPQELRRRAFVALRELLTRLGDRKPIVLFIDDLQWGDLDSAAALSELLRPPDPPVVLLIGCFRSEDATTSRPLQVLSELQREVGSALEWQELAIEPLPEREAEDLARDLLAVGGREFDRQVAAIARESGGNPFFLTELVRYFQSGLAVPDGSSSAIPIRLEHVLSARIRRLPEGARRLLEVVAVSSRPIGEVEACRAAELGEEGRSALAQLRCGRLVRGTTRMEWGEVETYHDRVRETVVAQLPPDVLEGHHLRLATTLEDSGRADPEALAVHFFGGKDYRRAGDYFAKAGDQAAEALAFERAAWLYRCALEPPSDPGRLAYPLRVKLGDALANARRGDEAAREYLAAVSGAPADEALDLKRRAAEQFLISGRIDKGLAVLEQVFGEVGMALPKSPGRVLWSLLTHRAKIRLHGLAHKRRDPSQIPLAELQKIDVCWAASCGLSLTDTVRGADFQARNLYLALRAGEPHRLARALAVEAGYEAAGGSRSVKRTSQLLRVAELLAQQVATPYALGIVAFGRGASANLQGDWRTSIEYCDRAAEAFRDHCTGVAWELNASSIFALWSLQYAGELREINRRRRQSLREAHERGDLHAVTTLSTISLGRLGDDDPHGITEELRQVISRWTYPGFHVQHYHCTQSMVNSYLYLGDPHSAWVYLLEQWPAYRASLLPRFQRARVDMLYSRARTLLAMASSSHRPHAMVRSALRDAWRIERENVSFGAALAKLLRGAAASIRGDRRFALSLLDDASTALDAVAMPIHAAAARRLLGEIQGGEQGVAMIEQADKWLLNRGARRPDCMAMMYAPGLACKKALRRPERVSS